MLNAEKVENNSKLVTLAKFTNNITEESGRLLFIAALD